MSSAEWVLPQRDDLEWLVGRVEEAGQNSELGRRWLAVLHLVPMELEDQAPASQPENAGDVLATERQRRLDQKRNNRDVSERREAKRLNALARDREALNSRRVGIRAGTDLDALAALSHRYLGAGTFEAVEEVDLDKLRQALGEELVDDVRAGFVAAWRRLSVALRLPGESAIPNAVSVALTGLAIEISNGLDLASLTADEAAFAARLTIRELPSSPFWTGELLAVHRDAFLAELNAAVRLDWEAQVEDHGTLARAGSCSEALAIELRKIVLELLEVSGPAHPKTVRFAVDVLLRFSADAPQVRRLVLRELDAGPDAGKVEWFRALAHVAPAECAALLQKQRPEVVIAVSSRLGDDLLPVTQIRRNLGWQ